MTRLLLAFALFCSAAVPAASGSGDPVIRVAIARNISRFRLNTSASAYLLEIRTGQRYQLVEKSFYVVKYLGPFRLAVAGQTL